MIGFVLVLIADVLVVLYIKELKTSEINSLFDVIDFIKKISMKVIDLKIPISEAVVKTKGEVSSYIDGIIDKFRNCSFGGTVRENLIEVINKDEKLKKKKKKIVVDYLNIFGKIPKENMEDYLKMTIDSLDKILLIKKENHIKTKKIINSIVYGVSFVLIILIV
jgi:hypothetical protein